MAESIYTVQKENLVRIADAIRNKAGKDESETLVFPDGFIDTIGEITGGNLRIQTGGFTTPLGSSGTSLKCKDRPITNLKFVPKLFYIFTSNSSASSTTVRKIVSSFYQNFSSNFTKFNVQAIYKAAAYGSGVTLDTKTNTGFQPVEKDNGTIEMQWQQENGDSSTYEFIGTVYYTWIAIG